MPKPLTRLKMLISCTSELQAERSLVEKVVSDVNRTIEDTFGVTTRVVDWRRDIVPGAGTDPQQVINAQTSDCEIYLGTLGNKRTYQAGWPKCVYRFRTVAIASVQDKTPSRDPTCGDSPGRLHRNRPTTSAFIARLAGT